MAWHTTHTQHPLTSTPDLPLEFIAKMSSLNLSEMENKILAYSWQCFKTGPPDVSEASVSLYDCYPFHF